MKKNEKHLIVLCYTINTQEEHFNFSNLMKHMNLYVHKSKETPQRINESHTNTHHNQTVERQNKNCERSKRHDSPCSDFSNNNISHQ